MRECDANGVKTVDADSHERGYMVTHDGIRAVTGSLGRCRGSSGQDVYASYVGTIKTASCSTRASPRLRGLVPQMSKQKAADNFGQLMRLLACIFK